MPRELKLPAFTPTPVFMMLKDGGDDDYCDASLEFDEMVCGDVNSFHKSPVVIMHQSDWDAFMEKVRYLEFLYATEEMRAGAIETSRDQYREMYQAYKKRSDLYWDALIAAQLPIPSEVD